jgi:hypothetical protein
MNEDNTVTQADVQHNPRRRSRGEDYVNNKEFSIAVAEHAQGVHADKAAGIEPRLMTNYIAECLLKIAQGLARSPNFMNYSYRDDMVMDAVENCVRVVGNYKVDTATRGGVPNAFGYFTLICWRAFLRRIAREKRQTEIQNRLIESGFLGNFMDVDDDHASIGDNMVEKVRQRNELYTDPKETRVVQKRKKRVAKKTSDSHTSDLYDFS